MLVWVTALFLKNEFNNDSEEVGLAPALSACIAII